MGEKIVKLKKKQTSQFENPFRIIYGTISARIYIINKIRKEQCDLSLFGRLNNDGRSK